MKKNIIMIGIIFLLCFSFFVYATDLKTSDYNGLEKLKTDYIKTENNLKIKFIEDDLSINSNVNYCSKGLNNSIMCDITINKNEIVYFDDIFKGITQPNYFYKDKTHYIVIFENVFSGYLHIGKNSDISFIGTEPLIYYFPTMDIDNYTVLDESLSSNNMKATLENGVYVYSNNSQENAYFTFKDQNDYVNITSNNTLDLNDNLTIIFWIQLEHDNPPGLYQTLFSMGDYSSGGRLKFFEIVYNTQEKIWVEIETNGGSARALTITTDALSVDNLWHMIAVTYCYNCGGQNRLNIYIDGQYESYTTQNYGAVGNFYGNGKNRIGNDRVSTYDYDGNMTNFLFFKGIRIEQPDLYTLYTLTNPLKNYYTVPTPVIINPSQYDNLTGNNYINYTCYDNDGIYSYLSIDGDIIFSGNFNNTNYLFDFSSILTGLHNLSLTCQDVENNITESILFYSYIESSSTPTTSINSIDLSGLNAVLLIIGIIFIYIGMLAIGVIKQSFAVLSGAIFIGLILGLSLWQYSNILSIVVIIINTGFFITIVANARNN